MTQRSRHSLLARRSPSAGGRSGFTLVEALIATALLGFSLIVMFGFHTQAVRSNMAARKITDCTYLAQSQMERLMAYPWGSTTTRGGGPLEAGATGSTSEWGDLYHSANGPGAAPTPVNAADSSADPTLGEFVYTITWDVEDMDTDGNWVRLRVRCKYQDKAFNTWRGTTISAFRFRDGA